MGRRRRIERCAPLPVLVCLLLGVAACGDRGGPTIRAFDPAQKPAASSSSASSRTVGSGAAVQGGGVHTVRAGETLYAIARAYKVGTRALISLNGLQPPYILYADQKLRIPAARSHTVRAGETVYGISRQYGVDMSRLVQVNRIRPPFTIRVGQKLEIPGRVVAAASVAARPIAAPPPAAPVQPPAPAKRGRLSDTERARLADEPLDAPAPRVQVAPVNPVADGPRAPRRGQTAPTVAAAKAEPFRVTAAGFPRPTRRPPGLQPVRLAAAQIPKPAPRANDAFLWPVQGRVISRFGPKPGGLHNDGLNIAAPRGTPIRAAENGVVVYAGSELAGFGNMVLLKHADGYVTAYAHAADVLVRRGDQVRRGQAIARVGSSGNVDRPQLHFEIRKGRRAINPKARLAG